MEEEYQDYETLILETEDGTEQEYAIIDRFEAEGRNYIIIAAIEEDAVSEETFLFRCNETEDSIDLEEIEDDAEFDRVSDYYDAAYGPKEEQ